MLETNFDYKGYTIWHTNDNVVVLYIPNLETKNKNHAISFDNGKTWCIGNTQTIVHSDFIGDFIKAIDICVELNEELNNEK